MPTSIQHINPIHMISETVLFIIELALALCLGVVIGLVLAGAMYSKLLNKQAWKALISRQQ